jgi:lactate dehydrogenase-like 2-hydroxyacid dehydrogenase
MSILYHGPNPKLNSEADLGVQYGKTLPELLPHIGSTARELPTDMAMGAFANLQSFLDEGNLIDCCV